MRELISSASECAKQGLHRFLADERATTSIEYALIASCVAVVIVVIVISTGNTLRDDIYMRVLNAYPS